MLKKKTNEDIVPQSSVILQTIVGVLVGGGEGGRRGSSKKALFRAVPMDIPWLAGLYQENRGRVFISDFVTVDLVYLLR